MLAWSDRLKVHTRMLRERQGSAASIANVMAGPAPPAAPKPPASARPHPPPPRPGTAGSSGRGSREGIPGPPLRPVTAGSNNGRGGNYKEAPSRDGTPDTQAAFDMENGGMADAMRKSGSPLD